MSTSAIIFFILCGICAIFALVIFFNGLGKQALYFLIFGAGAALLFREGMAETPKAGKEEKKRWNQISHKSMSFRKIQSH